jgi:hypothetical protein
MAKRFAPALFLLAFYFAAPIGLAMLAIGASARAVGIAYAIWFGAMLLPVMPGSKRWREKAGWAFGLGLFFTTPAILVLVLVLREAFGVA